MAYDLVMGIEVHVKLNTQSKLFSSAPSRYGAEPNTQCSYVDAALPGTLPVFNQAVLQKALRFGLAINANINKASWFERKNYFYPDLPKGYQISQHQSPIVGQGYLEVTLADGQIKTVSINRAHIEEDAGKSVHDATPEHSGIDLNRAGTPLLEIVTDPCFSSAEEVTSYLKTLHQLVRFIDISDGNMQEGSFRCDVNISLKPKGSTTLGTRTELKNINSFRYIEQAIHVESKRHKKILEDGGSITQETRLFDPKVMKTRAMRSKENENDYRYFPDPDLIVLHVDDAMLTKVADTMPDTPSQIKHKLAQNNHLVDEDITFLLSHPAHYHFFSTLNRQFDSQEKLIINTLKGPFVAALKEAQKTFLTSPIGVEALQELLTLYLEDAISHHALKTIIKEAVNTPDRLAILIDEEKKSGQQANDIVESLVLQCLQNNPAQVAQYHDGKHKLLGYFVGQVMKTSPTKLDPAFVSQIVKQFLQKQL